MSGDHNQHAGGSTRRVTWHKSEREIIAAGLLAIWRANPSKTDQSAVAEAQLVLPRDRRVVVSYPWCYRNRHWIRPVHAKALSLNAEQAVATNIAPEPSKREETPTERLAGVLDALLDIVADKLADRIAQRLQVQIETQTVTTTETPYRPRHNPEPLPTPAKSCRPGVLVLGLLSQTGEQMRREFGHRLDIQWYDTDDATTRQVHPMAHVVMMTKFVNHSVQERWRKAGVLHYCNGGVSQLREVLANL